MFSRSILSNYIGSTVGLVVSKGLRFFGVILCIRIVGNAGWGQAVSTIAIFSLVTFLIDQGLGASPLLFKLSERRADRRLLFLISGYRFSIALAAILALNAFHYGVHPINPLIRLYAWVLVPRALAVDWWFLRREMYQVTLVISSVRTLFFFLLILTMLSAHSGAGTIVGIELVTEAFSVLVGYLLMRLAPKRQLEGSETKFSLGELLYFSMPFLLIGIFNTIPNALDVLILKFFKGNEAVAEYDIGSKVGFLYFFLGATVIQIIRPKLTLLHQAGESGRIGSILRIASSMLMLLTGLFMIPSFFFSHEIMRLVFNNRTEMTVSVFRWVAFWVGTSFLTVLCTDTLLALGKRRDYVRSALVCAITSIGANLLLIPYFSGYGAIAAKILSEVACFGTALWWTPALIRREISKGLVFQGGILCFIIAFYLIFWLTGYRMVCVFAAFAVCGYGVVRSRIFTRHTLSVLREN